MAKYIVKKRRVDSKPEGGEGGGGTFFGGGVRNVSKMTHDFWEGREYPHFRLPFWFWWGGDRW